MRQAAISIRPAQIARDVKHNAQQSNPLTLTGRFKGDLLRLLRSLGDFVAAGGPLS